MLSLHEAVTKNNKQLCQYEGRGYHEENSEIIHQTSIISPWNQEFLVTDIKLVLPTISIF